MSWLKNFIPSRIRTEGGNKRAVPEGLWTKCSSCRSVLYQPELERNAQVCPKCGHHMAMRARDRLTHFLDEGDNEELGQAFLPADPLKFRDSKKYKDRLSQAQKKTGETDSLVVMRGRLKGRPVVASAFDFQFMGGSMGSVLGQRFVVGAERALDEGIPLINFSATGGARMQESLFSLMQMAKTAAALEKLSSAGLPYISVMTHPTTGGVSASLALLGDVNIAEPKALIGFAGPRVIEQTVRETLPEGFQRSEFLLEHGALDLIVDRRDMRDTVSRLLGLLLPVPDNALPAPETVEPEESDADEAKADEGAE